MGLFDFFKEEQPPLVERAFDNIREMLSYGDEMFAAATAHLLDNEILDVDLSALDEEINEREHELRRVVLEHLTIEPERELVFSLKMLSIVHEAERIGDLSKSLAKVGTLAKKPRMGDVVHPLRAMRDQILQMFKQTRKGFAEGDEVAARQVMKVHEGLKAEATRILLDLAEREDITSNEAIVYALAARLMSRVSSHLANIISTVASPFDRIRSAPSWPEESGTPA